MNKTHYLDFKSNSGGITRLNVTKDVWMEKLTFFAENHTYPEKLNNVIFDQQKEMSFTMADFTGQSGRLKNYSKVNETRQLPDGEVPCSPERRKEIMADIRKKSHLFN